MPSGATITVRVSLDVKAKLDQIAAGTRRSRSFIAGEAVAAYVDRELAILEGVKHGLADMEAGRLIPHDEAMAEIYDAIDAASASGADAV